MSLAKQKICGIYKKKRKFCEFSLFLFCQYLLLWFSSAINSLYTFSASMLTRCCVAQRKRVGLITQRSKDRNLPQQLLFFCCFSTTPSIAICNNHRVTLINYAWFEWISLNTPSTMDSNLSVLCSIAKIRDKWVYAVKKGFCRLFIFLNLF